MQIKELKFDGLFDIALGKDRETRTWRNKEIDWQEFLVRISKTHRTAESYKEYIAAKKDRQDEIKDVGGYVGGYLAQGRRKRNSVMHRQLLTLDADFATPDLWDDFTMLYGSAAAIYTTHKHAPDSPRYRLIIPVDRPVSPEEYQAIARRVTDRLGIDSFDHTTFQPIRLMYWPSTSKDGEYIFNYQDGPWLCADDILGTYFDWQDSSAWPMCTREEKAVKRGIDKQGDPLEKSGIVGAFCRSYSIQEAIETFLTDMYEACDVEDRYTYKEGSTAGGLVLYEDKFAYSHHGTDPVSGTLNNAFDLVRRHLYHLKDEDAKADTPGNRMPSYLAMTELCTKDPKVRKQLGSERLNEARYEFAVELEMPVDEEPENDEWLAELEVDGKGNHLSTINNVILVLKNDPVLKGKLALDQFEKREVALGDLPWRKVTWDDRYLKDADDSSFRHYLEAQYGLSGILKIKDALNITVNTNGFHPVREYLSGLTWDGEERLSFLLTDYMGAENNEYTRTVTRKTFVGAVARIFRPGIKFDTVLTLVGAQGLYKSELISRMGRLWASDSLYTIHGKDAYEAVQGIWIMEIAELSAFKGAEVEAIKHFVSKKTDRFRVAYGERIENFPRQCIFIASHNKKHFLKDPTGGRRWWPVICEKDTRTKNVFQDLDEYEVNQLWAEAVELFKAGETLHLNERQETLATIVQTDHNEVDERFGMIQQYLDTLLPDNWEGLNIYQRRDFLQGGEINPAGTVIRNRVCIAEIWCELLIGQQKDMTRFNTKELHDIMRQMPGWAEAHSKTDFTNYGTQRAYRREQKNKVSNGTRVAVFSEKMN